MNLEEGDKEGREEEQDGYILDSSLKKLEVLEDLVGSLDVVELLCCCLEKKEALSRDLRLAFIFPDIARNRVNSVAIATIKQVKWLVRVWW